MYKKILTTTLLYLISAASLADENKVEAPEIKSAGDVVKYSSPDDWRTVNNDNLLVMTLGNGEVVIELNDQFAPNHIENIRTLVEGGYFDGTAVIRSHDNYVAQWGDPDAMEEGKGKSIGKAKEKVEVEFFKNLSDINFTPIVSRDAYAEQVGFSNGWPTASDGKKAWLTHCYGMVGVGRGMGSDSGNGKFLYAITGHAPRHLDLNVTLVGRVLSGIENLSSLPRGTGFLGFYETPEEHMPISAVRVGDSKGRQFQVMKTDTPTFKQYVDLKTTRKGEWFLEPVGKIELCNVGVPMREKPNEKSSEKS